MKYEKQPLNSRDRRLALGHYDDYKMSSATSLHDVYGSFSRAKAEAWKYCEELMQRFDGYGLRVISSNGWMFTAGFMFEEDGKQMFMYISPNRDIAVEVA